MKRQFISFILLIIIVVLTSCSDHAETYNTKPSAPPSLISNEADKQDSADTGSGSDGDGLPSASTSAPDKSGRYSSVQIPPFDAEQYQQDLSRLAEQPSDAVGTLYLYNSESNPLGASTAFVIGSNGLIATACHCILAPHAAQAEFSITLDGKDTIFKVTSVVSYSETMDLALLRVDAPCLPALKLGDPSQLKVLDDIIIVGTPYGIEPLQGAAAKGSISKLQPYNGMPKIVANISAYPGNSGSPVLNMSNEVIGVLQAGYSGADNYHLIAPISGLAPLLGYDLGISLDKFSNSLKYGVVKEDYGYYMGRINNWEPSDEGSIIQYSTYDDQYQLADRLHNMFIANYGGLITMLDTDTWDLGAHVDNAWGLKALPYEDSGNCSYAFGSFAEVEEDSGYVYLKSIGRAITYDPNNDYLMEQAVYSNEVPGVKNGPFMAYRTTAGGYDLICGEYKYGVKDGSFTIYSSKNDEVSFFTLTGDNINGVYTRVNMSGEFSQVNYKESVETNAWSPYSAEKNSIYNFSIGDGGTVYIDSEMFGTHFAKNGDGVQFKTDDAYMRKSGDTLTIEDIPGALTSWLYPGGLFMLDSSHSKSSAYIDLNSMDLLMGFFNEDHRFDNNSGSTGLYMFDTGDMYSGHLNYLQGENRGWSIEGEGVYWNNNKKSLYAGSLSGGAPQGEGTLMGNYDWDNVLHGFWNGDQLEKPYDNEYLQVQ